MAKITEFKTKTDKQRYRAAFTSNGGEKKLVCRSYESAAGVIYCEWFLDKIHQMTSRFSGFLRDITVKEAVICWIGRRYDLLSRGEISEIVAARSRALRVIESSKKLADISNADVAVWGLSKHCTRELVLAMNYFVSVNVIDCNVIKADKYRKKTITLMDADDLKYVASALTEQELVFFELCLICGMRRGEAAGIKISDIGEDFVFVRRHVLPSERVVSGTKKGGERVIPVDSVFCEKLKASYKNYNYNGWLFYENGSRIRLLTIVNRIKSRTGFSDFHGLRHRAASRWIEEGFTVAEVSNMLGHSSAAVTYNTYVHLIDRPRKATEMRY